VAVSFEAIDALNLPATIVNISLNKTSLETFRAGHDIGRLLQPDGEEVLEFEELKDGGMYRAIRKFDAQKHRYQIDDEVLEMEASECLFQELRTNSNAVHLHQNVKVYEGNNDSVSSQFDAIVHGDIAENKYAIVMEANTKVHPSDLSVVLAKAALFDKYLTTTSSLSCTSGFNPAVKREPFAHYGNVKHVIPCLAGRHFSTELVDACCTRGIIPVFPSGFRYVVKMLHLLVPKIVK